MDQASFSIKRRAPLLSINLLALLLSGTSCRQAICADAPDTCLAIDVTAEDGLVPSGPIEVVLLDRACNMLGRYGQSKAASSTLPGLVEVRLNTEGHAPIRREDVARVVVLAWPDVGLPWSGAIRAETGTRLSAQLHRPTTAMRSLSKQEGMGVRELVAATDKVAQYYFFLDAEGFKGAPIDDRKKLGLPKKILLNPPVSVDSSLLTAIMVNSQVRISVNEAIGFLVGLHLRTSLLDSTLTSSCENKPHIISDNTVSSWGIVMNHSSDGSKVGLLQMDAMMNPLSIAMSSSTCGGSFPMPNSVISISNYNNKKLFAIYPKTGQTKFVAMIVDEKLRNFKFENMELNDNYEIEIPITVDSIISVAFSDMNRDGQPEIIIGTKDGKLFSFAEQNGEWKSSNLSLQPIQLMNHGESDISLIRLSDFNGDTLVDVALGGTDKTRLYFGDGRGGFVEGSPIEVKVKAMDAADLNAADAGNACADELVVSDGSSIFLYSMEP